MEYKARMLSLHRNAKLLQDLNFYFDKDKCHILNSFVVPVHPTECRNRVWATVRWVFQRP